MAHSGASNRAWHIYTDRPIYFKARSILLPVYKILHLFFPSSPECLARTFGLYRDPNPQTHMNQEPSGITKQALTKTDTPAERHQSVHIHDGGLFLISAACKTASPGECWRGALLQEVSWTMSAAENRTPLQRGQTEQPTVSRDALACDILWLATGDVSLYFHAADKQTNLFLLEGGQCYLFYLIGNNC